MTDTIRPLIADVAPALLGTGSRTLSDIYDALTSDTSAAERHTELLAALALIATALGTTNTLAGLIEVGVTNTNTKLDAIGAAIDVSSPPEPYATIREYLSQIAEQAGVAVEELTALIGTTQTGNSFLENIDINIASNNTLTADITTAIEANTQATLDTSVSIRGEFVTIVDAVAGGASATVAEIVAQTTALEGAIDAQTTALEGAIDAQTTALEGAIGTQTTALEGAIGTQTAALGAKLDTLDTLLDAAFAAQGVRHIDLMDRLLQICLAVGGCDS